LVAGSFFALFVPFPLGAFGVIFFSATPSHPLLDRSTKESCLRGGTSDVAGITERG
jgi:hypothetical protein